MSFGHRCLLNILACLLALPLAAQERLRIADPTALVGQGIQVEPRTGRMSFTAPLMSVPGPMPIELVFRFNGSFAEQTTTALVRVWDPASRRYIWEPVDMTNLSRPVYGTVHFGYISGSATFGIVNDPGTYVLESGAQFRDRDLKPFTEWNATFTLPETFGLSSKAPSAVRVTVGGSHAVYAATRAELGGLASSLVAPTGFGAAPEAFTVVLDKDRARIYAQVGPSNTWAPMLWVDRFGNKVTFAWSKASGASPEIETLYGVEVRNHLNKGLQVQWAVYREGTPGSHDLFIVSPIGVNAPTLVATGHPGLASLAPSAASELGTWRTPATPRIAGPWGRPTALRWGARSDVGTPSWIGYGAQLPAVVEDGALAAPVMTWQFTYDANGAELTALQDPIGLRTAFTYGTLNIPPTDTSVANGKKVGNAVVRGITLTQATDIQTGKVLSRSWTRGATASNEPNVILRETFGSLSECPRYTELVYVPGSANALHYGNGAIQRVYLRDRNGTELASTIYGLANAGLDPAYSRAFQTTVTRQLEQPQVTIQVVDALGLQVNQIKQYVGSGTPRLIQETTLTYEARKDQLDAQRVTRSLTKRFNPSTGAQLTPMVDSNLTYTVKGQVQESYRVASGLSNLGYRYTYDTEGRMTSVEPLGAQHAPWESRSSYESWRWSPSEERLQMQINEAYPAMQEVSRARVELIDSAERPLTSLDLRGVRTTTVYDLFGRPRRSQTEGLGLVEIEYGDGRVTTQRRTVGAGKVLISTRSVNAFGQVLEQTGPDGTSLRYDYDDLGRVERTHRVSSLGKVVSREAVARDLLDRPTLRTSPGGASENLAYSVSGLNNRVTATRTFVNGPLTQTATTQVDRDAFGQVARTQGADGTVTTTTYDGLGNPLRVVTLPPYDGGPLPKPLPGEEPPEITLPDPQERIFNYDGHGRLTSKVEPETGTIAFVNDAVHGKPLAITEASGRKRTLAYDGLGRLLKVTSSSGEVLLTYSYTGADLVQATTLSNGQTVTQQFTYSTGPGRRLEAETTTFPGYAATVSYGYDTWGNPASLTYPNGRVASYGYDALGRISTVTYNGQPVVSNIAYDEWGVRSNLAFASGAYSRWSTKQNEGLLLDAWTIGLNGGAIPGGIRTYCYDSGERLSSAGEWTLVQDAQGRLTQANFMPQSTGDPSAFSTFHGHDPFGNNTAHTKAGAAPSSLNVFSLPDLPNNRLPALTTNGAMTGWDYSANGEATSIGLATGAAQVMGLVWDGLGRLHQANHPAARQTYTYAPTGLRVALADASSSARSRAFAYTAGGLLISEYGLGGSWLRDVIYVGGDPVAEADGSGLHELHKDHLGSPRVVTKGGTGQIEGRISFGPYGERIPNSSSDNAYLPLTGYTGHIQEDATGLIYMRGRYYSPVWHRFLNSDHGVDLSQWNQMAYVGGSPFMATDPTGMMKKAPTNAGGVLWWQYMNDGFAYGSSAAGLLGYGPWAGGLSNIDVAMMSTWANLGVGMSLGRMLKLDMLAMGLSLDFGRLRNPKYTQYADVSLSNNKGVVNGYLDNEDPEARRLIAIADSVLILEWMHGSSMVSNMLNQIWNQGKMTIGSTTDFTAPFWGDYGQRMIGIYTGGYGALPDGFVKTMMMTVNCGKWGDLVSSIEIAFAHELGHLLGYRDAVSPYNWEVIENKLRMLWGYPRRIKY